MRLHRPPRIGTARLTLAALLATGIVMAWRAFESDERWWLIAPAVALVVLLGWWHGVHLTTIAARWVAMVWRNRRRGGRRRAAVDTSAVDARTTALVQIDAHDGELPLPVLTSYLDRYGIKCAGVRVTRLDPQRVTWIGLTISAADNLAALLARGAQVPLSETAHAVQRRLADHLRELGWEVHLVDASDIPWPAPVREHWRGTRVDGSHFAAYQVRVDKSLPETLSRISASPVLQTWTVLEVTGNPARPALAVACALLTADKPGRRPPVEGITPHVGDHRTALDTLDPASTKSLAGQAYPPDGLLDRLPWTTGGSSAGFDDGHNALRILSCVPQVAPFA